MANHVHKKSPIKSPHLVPASGRMVLRRANLNELVQEVAGLLPQHLNETICVKMELAPECLSVMADKTGIGEVVMNLVKNAAEAMPRGGTLTVTRSLSVLKHVGIRYQAVPVASCPLRIQGLEWIRSQWRGCLNLILRGRRGAGGDWVCR